VKREQENHHYLSDSLGLEATSCDMLLEKLKAGAGQKEEEV
jgi:hypothetical protein